MKKVLTVLSVASLAGALSVAGGCALTPEQLAEMEPINDTCPGSGEPVVDDYYVGYKGKKIAFCCEHCQEAWETKMTDDDKKAYLKETMAAK